MSEVLDRLKSALADRYSVERELGSGGMAVIYLAGDLRHERPVALKVLRPELTSVVAGERFLREIKLTAGLAHPHILPLHDSGEADGFLYYVMPYVEGESLRVRLDREKRLPIDEAVQIAREVADALSYAHDHNLLHRDIKPENILLEAGHAVVADFGIAKAITEAGGETLTQTGVVVGTPAYMSPEQASGDEEIDEKSDIYSLACVLYEMLAGEPPHAGASAREIVARRLLEDAPCVAKLRPDVSPAIDASLQRALSRDPASRFATVHHFVQELPLKSLSEGSVGARLPEAPNAFTRLWHKIRHPSLWHVLLAYVGCAWIVYETVRRLAAGLSWPGWFANLVVSLFVIALSVLFISAFARPTRERPAAQTDTPEVGSRPGRSLQRHRLVTWRNAGFAFVVPIAVWAVVAVGWLMLAGRTGTRAGEPGVAPGVANPFAFSRRVSVSSCRT
jgi:hypothetical protein